MTRPLTIKEQGLAKAYYKEADPVDAWLEFRPQDGDLSDKAIIRKYKTYLAKDHMADYCVKLANQMHETSVEEFKCDVIDLVAELGAWQTYLKENVASEKYIVDATKTLVDITLRKAELLGFRTDEEPASAGTGVWGHADRMHEIAEKFKAQGSMFPRPVSGNGHANGIKANGNGKAH